jgi:hypothetical protein
LANETDSIMPAAVLSISRPKRSTPIP